METLAEKQAEMKRSWSSFRPTPSRVPSEDFRRALSEGKKGFVYMFSVTGTPFVKIGRTSQDDPMKRVRQHLRSSPLKVDLFKLWLSINCVEMEARLHRFCAPYRMSKECFELDSHQLVEVCALGNYLCLEDHSLEKGTKIFDDFNVDCSDLDDPTYEQKEYIPEDWTFVCELDTCGQPNCLDVSHYHPDSDRFHGGWGRLFEKLKRQQNA